MSTKNKVCVLIFLVLLVFGILAKVDYAIHGYGGYYPPEEVVRYHWFWQWQVGIPLMSLAFAAAFWAGAPKTQRNLKMALGVFFTPVLLFVGQLEDYLFFMLNGIPFPEGEWT